MAVVYWLCVRYPNLNDVWTNHLLPFLQRHSAIGMRKHMAVVRFEMRQRIRIYRPTYPFTSCSNLHFQSHYRMFWLDKHHVVVGQASLHSYYHILHLYPDGAVVHCITCISLTPDAHVIDFSVRDVLLMNARDEIDGVSCFKRIDERTLVRVDPRKVEPQCVCLNRVSLLFAIHNRNR
jgi:hypothetical protein